MRIHVLDDGVFITDAGNLFGGSRKMRIRGAMHAVLVETGEDLVLIDAGFGPELPEALADRYELKREKSLMDRLEESGHSRSEEHTSELQSRQYLVCRLLLEKKITDLRHYYVLLAAYVCSHLP